MQNTEESGQPRATAAAPDANPEPMTHTTRLEPSPTFVAEQKAEQQAPASPSASLPPAPPQSPVPTATDAPAPVYPDGSREHRSWNSINNAHELQQAETEAANFNFAELSVLGAGVASATCYFLLYYLVKNIWVTMVVCVLFALAALYLAVTTYNKTRQMTPYSVMGISAAILTIIYVTNGLIAYLVARSLLSY